jgi:hypothetical protein
MTTENIIKKKEVANFLNPASAGISGNFRYFTDHPG